MAYVDDGGIPEEIDVRNQSFSISGSQFMRALVFDNGIYGISKQYESFCLFRIFYRPHLQQIRNLRCARRRSEKLWLVISVLRLATSLLCTLLVLVDHSLPCLRQRTGDFHRCPGVVNRDINGNSLMRRSKLVQLEPQNQNIRCTWYMGQMGMPGFYIRHKMACDVAGQC